MKNLNISVTNKIAKYLQRDGVIVCGNSDYQISFTFDSEWDKYEAKTARFIWNGKYWDQPFTGNVCPVPIIQNAVFVIVGVYAGDLRTTTPASIPCKRSILCDDVEINDVNIEACREQAVAAAYRAESAAAIAAAANPETQRAELEAFIASELAKRGQLKPEFANSIDELNESGDTSKLYVVPDKETGIPYICAYVTTTETRPAYTNLLSTATDATGVVLNGVGYVEKKRWGSSAKAFDDYKDGDTTLVGMIPFTLGQTLQIKGINVSSASDLTYTAFRGFKEDRTHLAEGYSNLAGDLGLQEVTTIDAVNNMITVAPESNLYGGLTDKMRYIAFTVFPTNGSENIIVTVDEEITDEVITETKSEWKSTGHAFVPADYEDKILNLETDVSELKNQSETLDARVSSLELSADESVPTYVVAEASRVANEVLSVRNAHSFVFGAISDLHTDGKDYPIIENWSASGVKHAGQGMNAINDITQLDLVAIFGDIIVDRFNDTYKEGFKYVRKCFHDVYKAVPYIQMQGNHDELSTDTTEQGRQKYYAYIGANNVGTITDYDNKFRNYGYRDFDNYKLRVIYLNTADVSDYEVAKDCYVSTEQLNWLNNVALNLSDTEWGIIVLSHHPLNWYGLSGLLPALTAYKAKKSGAELIAHFHGHLHNFRAERLDGNGEPTQDTNGVLTITIPNACYGRNNEYGTSSSSDDDTKARFGDAENGIQRQFNKKVGAAEDTAFNVVVVDRRYRKIHCFNYGAGVDREINY